MHHVRFYVSARGNSPVQEFIESCDNHTQAKISQLIMLLMEMGNLLKRPFADKVKGKIYELRARQTRILYFFCVGKEIILLHGFLKKTNAIDSADFKIAERRMMDWLSRNRR
jgi:phage-related protein